MTVPLPRARSTSKEEAVLPFTTPRSQIRRVTKCRSTLLLASVESLRNRGLFPQYRRLLPEEHHDAVLLGVAGIWHPIEVALAHYQACEDLGLTAAEQVAIGNEVAERIERTFLAALLKLATESGMTPWMGLGTCQKIFTRLFGDEGGIELVKLGPKDARLEILGLPLARIPYFRMAYAGVIQSGCEVFCKKAFVKVVPALCGPTSLGYAASWA